RELRQGVGAPATLVPDEVMAVMPAFGRAAPPVTDAHVEPSPAIAPFRQVLSHTAVAVAAVAITLTLAASGRQESPRTTLVMRTGGPPPGYTSGSRAARPEVDQTGGMSHSMRPGDRRQGRAPSWHVGIVGHRGRNLGRGSTGEPRRAAAGPPGPGGRQRQRRAPRDTRRRAEGPARGRGAGALTRRRGGGR